MTTDLLMHLDRETTYLSARDFARAAGARKPQVLYWAKAQYIVRREHGDYVFPLSELPKAKVMGVLVNQVGLEPGKASSLAGRLLKWFENSPDTAKAVLVFLDALYERFDDVMRLMKGTSFDCEVLDSLSTGREKNEARRKEVVNA